MEKHVVNLVNFVRGCEPRHENFDLYTPVVEEIKVNKQYGFKSTFLLQYDALIRDEYQKLFLAERDENMELGLWFEMGRPLTEAVGIEWRGRPGYDWDWYVNPGFLMAYTPLQRELIIDEAFRKFKEVFGEYPKVAGSWLLDSHSMAYMSEKYDMKAFCICREQFAVDAYTLWGGYYNGGYFASKNNALCPAQSDLTKIKTPVFRMLGIDPIYGYDEYKRQPNKGGCFTLEPGWPCGTDKTVSEWYFNEYFKNPCGAYAHVTTGQENSFGWFQLGTGYCVQAEIMDRMSKAGELAVETLGESGEKFAAAYAETPATALSAFTDWSDHGFQSIWFCCKNYRANLFREPDGKLFFRDINKFDDRYAERYLATPCTAWDARYDNLPVVDNRIWTTEAEGESALTFTRAIEAMQPADLCENADGTMTLTVHFVDGTTGKIHLLEEGIGFESCGALDYTTGKPEGDLCVCDNTLYFVHNHYAYEVPVKAEMSEIKGGYRLNPSDGTVALKLNVR